jgi:hypothetical protein
MDSNIAGNPGSIHPRTVSDLYLAFREFLSRYGWPILIVLFLLYYFRPQLNKLQADYSLKKANNPYRVQILDEDMKRVRARQQLDHLKNVEKLSTHTSDTPTAQPKISSELPEGC